MKPNEAHIAHLILAFQDGSISSVEKAELDARAKQLVIEELKR